MVTKKHHKVVIIGDVQRPGFLCTEAECEIQGGVQGNILDVARHDGTFDVDKTMINGYNI